MSILVVDDDDGLRQLLRTQLSDRGFVVDTAIDGTDALSCLKNRTYEIIVTDLDMPGLDGASLWKHARVTGYTGHWIMMTGNRGDPRVPTELLPVIEKPFRIAVLLDVIEQLRRGRESVRDQDKA